LKRAPRVNLQLITSNASDLARLGIDKRKHDSDRMHTLFTRIDPQLVLVVSILAGDRVPETFTSSDLTVAKGYLIFVLVFVALTSIIVSARSQVEPISLTNSTN